MPIEAWLISLLRAKLSAFAAVTQLLAELVTPFQARVFCRRAALFISIAAMTVVAVPTSEVAFWNADWAAMSVDLLASPEATTSPVDLKRVWLLRVAPRASARGAAGMSGA